MEMPDVSGWEATKRSLHEALQVLRAARLLGVDALPNELHYSTIPIEIGATTGPLKFGGELVLDFTRQEIHYNTDGLEVFTVRLEGHHQKSLAQAVFAAFRQAGYSLEPDLSRAQGTTPFKLDSGVAQDMARVMWRMNTALARLKAQLYGMQTPVALWPHGFDLSTLWFAAGMNEHEDPHINFGFSPGTPEIGQPYAYFYAWPVPRGLQDRLPPEIEWITEWSTPGGIIRYDRIAGANDPEGLVTDTLLAVYRVAGPMLR